jgi:hypothetical protein
MTTALQNLITEAQADAKDRRHGYAYSEVDGHLIRIRWQATDDGNNAPWPHFRKGAHIFIDNIRVPYKKALDIIH